MNIIKSRGNSWQACLRLAAFFSIALLLTPRALQAGDKEHGYLGVYLESLDDETREALKYKGDGALVDDVADDSPADEAGVQEGDIIIKYNGKAVKDTEGLQKMLSTSSPGEKADLVVFRDGKEVKLSAKLSKADEDYRKIFVKGRRMGRPGKMLMRGNCCGSGKCNVWLGVEVQKLSKQLAEYFKVKEGEGMLVSTVVEGGPAEKSGIKAGDVIVKVGDEEVENHADLIDAICGSKSGDAVDVSVVRDGQQKTIKVTLAEMPDDQCDTQGLRGLGMNWYGPKGLELNLEGIGPEIERYLQVVPEHFDGSMEKLQQQLDQLKEELDKLKVQVETK